MQELFPFYSIGHFINQPANPTEFEVTRFDEMEEPDVAEIHKHRFYEIIWIEKGKGRQTIDHREYAVSPGSVFFIAPGQIHRFEEWEQIIGGSIMFTEDFFLFDHHDKHKLFELTFLDNFYLNPCVELNKNDFSDIRRTVELIVREEKRSDKSRLITRAYLHVLLGQVQRSLNKRNKSPISKRNLLLYKHFKSLLDKHFAENKTTAFYAEQLNITQHHLNSIVKGITGKTTTQVIRARSISEAKRLLAFTDQTVSEIAAGLNYFDSSYFTKIFKLDTGVTPIVFKNAFSEKYLEKSVLL